LIHILRALSPVGCGAAPAMSPDWGSDTFSEHSSTLRLNGSTRRVCKGQKGCDSEDISSEIARTVIYLIMLFAQMLCTIQTLSPGPFHNTVMFVHWVLSQHFNLVSEDASCIRLLCQSNLRGEVYNSALKRLLTMKTLKAAAE
jgi:hypothetical protein